jgi:hypothetical protein
MAPFVNRRVFPSLTDRKDVDRQVLDRQILGIDDTRNAAE